MPLFPLRNRLKIEGVMPERALLRLKRGGISLYFVQKTQKNTLLLQVKRKDIEKVFAIYPNVCYNSSAYTAYRVTDLGGVGLAKAFDFSKKRAGAILGALAFCGLTLAADTTLFGVEIVGNPVYKREVLATLAEYGVRPFASYPKGREEEITAKLLSLNGVEFCSVKKVGLWARVEMRVGNMEQREAARGTLVAEDRGIIVDMAVLQGTPLKKIGDTVAVGEPLVGDWFCTQEGEQVSVEPIARVRIACVYEGAYEGSAAEAFANAYLALSVEGTLQITEKSITPTEEGFHVKISYLVTQTRNL